jgi:hypothetical protein
MAHEFALMNGISGQSFTGVNYYFPLADNTSVILPGADSGLCENRAVQALSPISSSPFSGRLMV